MAIKSLLNDGKWGPPWGILVKFPWSLQPELLLSPVLGPGMVCRSLEFTATSWWLIYVYVSPWPADTVCFRVCVLLVLGFLSTSQAQAWVASDNGRESLKMLYEWLRCLQSRSFEILKTNTHLEEKKLTWGPWYPTLEANKLNPRWALLIFLITQR